MFPAVASASSCLCVRPRCAFPGVRAGSCSAAVTAVTAAVHCSHCSTAVTAAVGRCHRNYFYTVKYICFIIIQPSASGTTLNCQVVVFSCNISLNNGMFIPFFAVEKQSNLIDPIFRLHMVLWRIIKPVHIYFSLFLNTSWSAPGSCKPSCSRFRQLMM